MNNKSHLFNENNIRDKAFLKNMDAISNRRVVQFIRTRLFQKVDFQPKNLVKENLINTKIMDDIFHEIHFATNEILELLYENKLIFDKFFLRKYSSCYDILLPGEEELYYWDIHYYKWLNLIESSDLLIMGNSIDYYQKLYEFIIKDMTYGDVYDTIHIIDEEY